MPNLPKPDGTHHDPHGAQRRRAPSTTLPASGYDGPIPDPVAELDPVALAFYRRAWRSPVGAAWHDSDGLLVEEWAQLKAAIGRQLAEGTEQAALLGQLKAREEALGMTPKARAQLRWRIVDDSGLELDDETNYGGRFASAAILD